MKNNRNKWLSAICAIALVAVVSLTFAFKSSYNVGKKSVFATKWYQYNGGSSLSETSYELMSPQPTDNAAGSICAGKNKVCVIKAPEGPSNQPQNFTGTSLASEISNALSNHISSANVKLRD